MQLNVLPRNCGTQGQGSEVPRDSLVVIILADIPGVRHMDDFGSGRQGCVPSLFFAFFFAIYPEAPTAIEIHSRGCMQRKGSQNHI